METIARWNRTLNTAAAYVAGVLALLLAVITIIDVAGRYFLNSPLRGSVEISTELLVGLVFLSIGYLQMNRRHIVVDFMNEVMSRKALARMDYLIDFVALIILGILSWKTAFNAAESWRMNETSSGSLAIPYAPARTVIALGLIMYTVTVLIQLLQRFLRPRASTTAEVK